LLKRLLGRDTFDIPKQKIVMYPRLGIEYQWYLSRCRTEAERIRVNLQIGKKFGELCARKGFGGATHVYTFSGAGLEILEAAREAGLKTVVEQPAAASEVEQSIMRDERERYPDWEPFAPCQDELKAYAARQRREWDLADRIVVPSEFVAASLESVGVSPDRFVTVPYGVGGLFGEIEREKHTGPLRVLTVGEVRLQKGAQYTCEAAKQLGKGFEFRLVGSWSFSDSARVQLSENVCIVGHVPRSEIQSHYQWADVFLFPSLCDGFGLVLLEALAAGLPVITTLNTGIAIREGIDGFIVPIRDTRAIALRLSQLSEDPALLEEMSRSARKRSAAFSLNAYGDRLYNAISAVR
jgi:glycosyltransferase involved in cell wall biosynthesis